MGTPVGKPAKSNVLDYAPRHLREGAGPRRVDEDATPPPRPADEEPLDDVGADDEQNEIPLAPEAPHDEIGGEAGRDREDAASEDERVYRLHAHRSEDDAPQDEPARSFEEDVGSASSSFEDDIAQLAALLESIRRGN